MKIRNRCCNATPPCLASADTWVSHYVHLQRLDQSIQFMEISPSSSRQCFGFEIHLTRKCDDRLTDHPLDSRYTTRIERTDKRSLRAACLLFFHPSKYLSMELLHISQSPTNESRARLPSGPNHIQVPKNSALLLLSHHTWHAEAGMDDCRVSLSGPWTFFPLTWLISVSANKFVYSVIAAMNRPEVN